MTTQTTTRNPRRLDITTAFPTPSTLQVTFDIRNVPDLRVLQLDISTLSDDFIRQAVMLGCIHKVQSTISPTTSPESLTEALDALLDSFNAGVFPVKTIPPVRVPQVVKALAAAHGADVTSDDVLREYKGIWERKTAVEKRELAAHPRVQYELNVLKIDEAQDAATVAPPAL